MRRVLGHGAREMFLANAERFVPGRNLRLISEDSTALLGKEAVLGLQDLRFVSIDGGHTRSATLNDLQVADRTLTDAGVCVLDDVFHAHWPGVITGLFDYLALPGQRLVPVAFVPNKLVLCRPNLRGRYAEWLRGILGSALERRDVELGGFPIDVYGELAPSVLTRIGVPPASTKATDAERERDAVAARLAETETRLDALLRSRSWLLTRPLRAAFALMRNR